MSETKEIQVMPPQSVSEIKSQIQAIQQVMKSVMKPKEHYGTLPGCGDKPVLFKPGAEKIMATFRIAPKFEIEDLSTSDECRYRVISTGVYSPDGTFLGQGVGECSSNEEKYKWRASVCNEEYNETPENRRRSKWKKGYNGKPAYSIDQVRTDHADQANTVLKMAVKRAQVAMVLTVTGASDIFAQDLEDMPGHEVPNEKNDIKSSVQSQQKFYCAKCNTEISEAENGFSVKAFGKPLCRTHQAEARKAK